MQDSLYLKSVEYLKSNTLKHLSTLKHLFLYKDNVTIDLIEDSLKWALLVKIPTKFLSYDSATYPNANQAIFLNGTSDELKYYLLDKLPDDNYILRLNENLNLATYKNRFQVAVGNSYVSYSCSSIDDIYRDDMVLGNPNITDKAIDIIKRNGYTEPEIRKYFNNGAIWFGYIIDDIIRSICFVYRNYEDIWEIAGVHTPETERMKGYARIVVTSALAYILDRRLIPRYEADVRNVNSIKLTESLKMKQFLRVDHFLLNIQKGLLK